MIRNYIVVALRNISRHPTYAFINIFGLSIGIVCSLMLILFVHEELKIDTQHDLADRIYRINSHVTAQDTELDLASVMSPMGPTLYEKFPEVESFLRVQAMGNQLLVHEDKKFYEGSAYFVDSTFFKFFNFDLTFGDKKTCLVEPNSIVLSEKVARKLFGEGNPLGMAIKVGGEGELKKVTGVLKEQYFQSHLRPNILISYSTLPSLGPIAWGNLNDHTYILLPELYNPDSFQGNFDIVYDEYIRPLFEEFQVYAEFELMPMGSIYLYSKTEDQIGETGDINYIYIFGAIAIFILLIASINYMNLATARSANRSREVGIRKAMGSYRLQLMIQFMAESVVLTALAVLLSSLITFFLIPSFNELSGREIPINFLSDPMVIAGMVGIIIFVGLVGGSYPSLFLSSFNPAEVLKSKEGGVKSSARLRKILVVAQFSISLVMVISTWVVYDQLNFLENKSLGFAKDRVIRVGLDGQEVISKYPSLRNELLNHPGIESIGSGGSTPGGNNISMNGIFVESTDGDMVEKIFTTMNIDKDYVDALEISLAEGRNFSHNITLDTSSAVLVNQEMVRHMGWENPIGKKFNVVINQNLDVQEKKVVGVIRDFHMRSLKDPIHPVVVHNRVENGYMVIRIKPSNITETLSFIENKWSEVITNRPFEYSFLEQDFYEQYENDQKRGEVFGLFAIFTIFISCLGLFGLASFTAENRRKEISIRKAIGAGTLSIVFMMSVEFLKLVFVAIVIAFPIAFLMMGQWLEEFAFRTTLSPLSFCLSACLTILIAFLTVSYHSITSATSNPSDALRE